MKGVAGYFHQRQSATSEWKSFASTMAASVVAKMLNDPTVFREWPHFNEGKSQLFRLLLKFYFFQNSLKFVGFYLISYLIWSHRCRPKIGGERS